MFGLGGFEQQELKDEDDTTYSLKKFLRLALVNNPNILELLFVPKESIILYTEPYSEMRRNKERLVSKRIFKAYFGYAKAQLIRLERCHTDEMTSKRKDNVLKFGYDTKAAMHMFRLLEQCKTLASIGTIVLPICGHNLSTLVEVRDGEYTIEEIKELANEKFKYLREIEKTSDLPEEPDFHFWNDLCVSLHKEHFKS
jgi:predicted nucleotidyltransferase